MVEGSNEVLEVLRQPDLGLGRSRVGMWEGGIGTPLGCHAAAPQLLLKEEPATLAHSGPSSSLE